MAQCVLQKRRFSWHLFLPDVEHRRELRKILDLRGEEHRRRDRGA